MVEAILMMASIFVGGCANEPTRLVDQPTIAAPREVSEAAECLPYAPAPAEIAGRFRDTLSRLDRLAVVATQQVSLVRHALSDDESDAPLETNALQAIADGKAVESVEVKVAASMTRESFEVKMWKSGLLHPALELSLVLNDGTPTVTERHWYPVWNRYREVAYSSPHPAGIDSLAVQSSLFNELKSTVCATAEFFHTWLGDSPQADDLQSAIGQSTSAVSELLNGERVYRLTRPVYERELPQHYRSRRDTFWVSAESNLLVRWRKELIDMNYGHDLSSRRLYVPVSS